MLKISWAKVLGLTMAAAAAVSAASASAMTVEERVKALLGKMTLEEKIGQLNQDACWVNGMYEATDSSIRGEPAAEFLDKVRRGEVGSVLGATGLRNYNLLQQAAKESRLGIPLMVGHDLIHGCYTTLPIPLALACAWDEELWQKGADMTAREGRLKGVNWTFAPMLDISRDPRWGRIAESAGQDPYLASRYAVAMVKGLQGENVADGTHLAACLKHFVGYGAAAGGRDYAEVEMSDSTLRDIYLPPFAAAIKAGALTLMPAFHTLNDVPCSVNRYLLKDILRDELKFDGMLISDYAAIGECRTGHRVAETVSEVAAMALKATVDQDMMSFTYRDGLKEALDKGLVTMADIDYAVANVLRAKFRLGLFEHPFIDGAAASNRVDFAADRALAREAAAKSCVLLKNERETLPLKKGVKIALLGDIMGMDREMKGCWQAYWDNLDHPSLKAALEARGADFVFALSYTITGACDRAAIRAAVKDADAVVAGFGEYSYQKIMSGENYTYTDIRLQPGQREAIDEIKQSGKPFVAVLFSGRPMAIPELAEAADAILEAWHPGSSGGPAMADLLFGDAEPYGRLTADFPWTSGQTPIYYNRLATGRPNNPDSFWTTHYEDVPYEPLYSFGHGLAYTTFAYTNEAVRVDGDRVVLTCEVKNTGKRAGYEVVQAYVRDCVGRISRPVRELKGFKRVYLKAGETAEVAIVIPRGDLAYHVEGKRVLADGEFEAYLAPNARAGKKLSFSLAPLDTAKLKRVLMIGNSFSISCMNHLPQVAADRGVALDLASLFIGGCSLEWHWNNVLADGKETDGRPYAPYLFTRNCCGQETSGYINVCDALRLAKWDVVTVQQASHESWRAASYRPFGDDLIAKVRELAPQAEIVVQETWSYTPFDGRLAEWKITPEEMYAKLHAAYGDFARRHGLKVIPFGTAVQEWRRRLPVRYTASSFGGDVVGGRWAADPAKMFVSDGKGGFRPNCDVFHLSERGEYFQALVWASALFGVDVGACRYCPGFVTEKDFALMAKIAAELTGKTRK